MCQCLSKQHNKRRHQYLNYDNCNRKNNKSQRFNSILSLFYDQNIDRNQMNRSPLFNMYRSQIKSDNYNNLTSINDENSPKFKTMSKLLNIYNITNNDGIKMTKSLKEDLPSCDMKTILLQNYSLTMKQPMNDDDLMIRSSSNIDWNNLNLMHSKIKENLSNEFKLKNDDNADSRGVRNLSPKQMQSLKRSKILMKQSIKFEKIRKQSKATKKKI